MIEKNWYSNFYLSILTYLLTNYHLTYSTHYSITVSLEETGFYKATKFYKQCGGADLIPKLRSLYCRVP